MAEIDDLLKEYDKKPATPAGADDIDHLLKLYPDTALPVAPRAQMTPPPSGYAGMPSVDEYGRPMQTLATVPDSPNPAIGNVLPAMGRGFVEGAERGRLGTEPILMPYASDQLNNWWSGRNIYGPAIQLADSAHAGVNALMSGVTGAIGAGTEAAGYPALGRDINMALQVSPMAARPFPSLMRETPLPGPRTIQDLMAPKSIEGQTTLGRINDLIRHDENFNNPATSPGYYPPGVNPNASAFMPPGSASPVSSAPAFIPPNPLVARPGETGLPLNAVSPKTEPPPVGKNDVVPNGLTPEQVAEFRNIPEALPPMKGEIKTPEDAAKRADDIINHFASIGNKEPIPGAEGALPTITGNSGLATLYRAVRDSDTPVPFTTLENASKTTAMSKLREMVGTEDDLKAAVKDRADTVDPLYKQAWANKTEADPSGAIKTVEDLMNSPLKQNDTAMAELKNIREKLQGQTDPEQLKGITDHIDETLARLKPEGKADRRTLGALDQVDKAITAEISRTTPGFDTAQATYADLSRRIDEMKYFQGRKLTDLQGNPTLGNMRSTLDDIAKKQAGDKFHPADSVTEDNRQTLQKIHDQMQREAFTTTAGKSLGSNTFQNLATNTMTGKIAGHVGNALVSTGAGMLTDLAAGGGGATGALTGAAASGVLKGYAAKQAVKAEARQAAGQQMLMRELRDRLLNIDNKGVMALRGSAPP